MNLTRKKGSASLWRRRVGLGREKGRQIKTLLGVAIPLTCSGREGIVLGKQVLVKTEGRDMKRSVLKRQEFVIGHEGLQIEGACNRFWSGKGNRLEL